MTVARYPHRRRLANVYEYASLDVKRPDLRVCGIFSEQKTPAHNVETKS